MALIDRFQKFRENTLEKQQREKARLQPLIDEIDRRFEIERREREEDEYQQVIAKVPQIAEDAIKRGERSCIVMWGYATVSNLQERLSLKDIPCVAQRVYGYCEREGLKPKITTRTVYCKKGREFCISIAW